MSYFEVDLQKQQVFVPSIFSHSMVYITYVTLRPKNAQ